MFHILLIAAFLAFVHTSVPIPKLEVKNRIVNGEGASITEAPWQVALLKNINGKFLAFCGGSIISSSTILTAVHCVKKTTVNQWKVRAGSTWSNRGGWIFHLKRIILHEDYGEDNDISILKLWTPLKYSPNIQPIGLPEQGQIIAEGTPALITGWGQLEEGSLFPEQLQKITLPVFNQQICKMLNADLHTVTDNMICAGYLYGTKDTCHGDSGGPMVVGTEKKILAGITSWGRGCGRLFSPGVYVRVSQHKNWILKHM